MFKINKKSQSILEYIVTIAAVVGFIVAATIGLRKGVKRGLDNVQEKIEVDLNDREYVGQPVKFDAEGKILISTKE